MATQKDILYIFCFLSLYFFSSIAFGQDPNFIIIVLDDQGWTGTSIPMISADNTTKSDYYLTPALESLASEGMVFSQGYASAPKCAPSRASLLTGKSTARNHFTSTDNDIKENVPLIEGLTELEIDHTQITYAEWLKSTNKNYRTAHIGKWHLGRGTNAHPENNGFDYSDGTTSNSDGNNGDGIVQDDPKMIFDLTNRSINFIENAIEDNVPFALQLSHYAVHNDIEAREETINKYKDLVKGNLHDDESYAAMTEDTDDGISQLLTAIKDLNIEDNTYIFFVSDNGGQMTFTDNFPLKHGKTFIFEGGIRVPFIVKGPNIEGGTYCNKPVILYDIFPTIADLTNHNVPLPTNIDGESFAKSLQGENDSRERPLYFHSPHYDQNPNKTPRSAIIDHNFKLIVEYETGNVLLYNLDNDISEDVNLSENEPEITASLKLKLKQYLKEVNATMPSLNPATNIGSGNDLDNDGLDDAWEIRELLSFHFNASDDPDNDGFTNLEEFNASTDPLSASEDSSPSIICDDNEIFSNETTNEYCETITENVRVITSNNIPAHEYGPFQGNNELQGQDFKHYMCLYPELGDNTTPLYVDPTDLNCGNGIVFGISDQGVVFSPFARLYFTNPNTQEENVEWNEEAAFILNMDENGGHVNAVNRYHYHKVPLQHYQENLNIDGSKHSPIVGYAADGFPIYYKYLYSNSLDENSNITDFNSGYQLKNGGRPGDGIQAPNGEYDGTYVEDYEYIDGKSSLDECGGRFGITPDYPNGTYYYVITDNWPYIPRCLNGKNIDNSFRLGNRCPESSANEDCSPSEIDWELTIDNDEVLSNNSSDNIQLIVYPNPTSNYLNFSISNNNWNQWLSSITIYNNNGKTLYYTEHFQPKINVSHWQKGVYFLQLNSKVGQITKKIIIQ